MREYHAWSLHYDGLAEQIITDIHVSDAVKAVSIPVGGEPDALPCKGLWDTGATNTVISKRIVERLELPAISKTKVFGVSGVFETTTHVVDLWLPNYFVIRRVPATQGILGEDCDVLIGMDIITGGDFTISNFQGKTTISYRRPSKAITDYVRQEELLHQAKSSKVDRNAHCPCGSGRKYKHCCGRA